MKRHALWLVLFVAVTATADNGRAKGGTSLRESLNAAANGKAVFLALDKDGHLVARTADGSFTKQIAAGPYMDGMLDEPRELVWLRSDTAFDVVDLRLPAGPAKKLVDVSPAKALEKYGTEMANAPHWTMSGPLDISLTTQCSVSSGLSIDLAHDKGGQLQGTQNVKVVAKDWFAAQEQRAVRTDVKAAPDEKPTRVKVKDKRACKGELGAKCGETVSAGAMPWRLAVVGGNEDKCPAYQCAAYDAKTKKFSPVPGVATDEEEVQTCGPYRFDASGANYLVEDQVCGADGKCASVGTWALGWLDGSHIVRFQ